MRSRIAQLFAAFAVVFLMACQDDSQKVAGHMESAEAYAEAESFPEAVIEYKNVLQIEPNHAGAHYGLAKAYLAQNLVRDGYWELSETVRLDPGNLEARLSFGRISWRFGKPEEALAEADAVVAAEPENVDAHMLRGLSLELLDRPEDAQAAYEKAIEIEPDNSSALLQLAAFHRRAGRRGEAEPLFKKVTEVDPNFVSYRAWGGFLALEEGREAEAEAAYLRALELADDDQRQIAYRTLASFYYSRGRSDWETLLKKGIEQQPDDLDLIYLLAGLYSAQGDNAKADQTIESATTARPDDVQPQLILSLYRGRKQDLPGALEAAESALKIDPEHVAARLRKAELLVEMGRREDRPDQVVQGRSIVDAVLAKNNSSPEALFVRAKIHLTENDPESAIKDLRRVMELKSDWAQANFLLGSALFSSGDRHGARAELRRALEIDAGMIDARAMLARVHGALGENELAIQEGRQVLKQRPKSNALRIIVAQSMVRERRVDEALAELEKIPAEERDVEALYAFGRIYRAKRDVAQSRSYLEQAIEKRPGHPEILRALVELDVTQDRVADSAARLDKALADDPDNARLVHLSGVVAMYSGDRIAAEKRLRRAIELDPNDMRFYQTLAQYLQMAGRRSEVLSTYERALRARPDSGPLHLIVGTLYEMGGDTDVAIEHYEEAIQYEPDLAPAKNNLAYIFAESGENLDRALDLAREAKSLLPENPAAADTLGWVLYKKGLYSTAIDYLKEADDGFEVDDPNKGVVRHHLALAYQANGDMRKARQTIDRALSDWASLKEANPNAPEPPWAAQLRSLRDNLEAPPAEG